MLEALRQDFSVGTEVNVYEVLADSPSFKAGLSASTKRKNALSILSGIDEGRLTSFIDPTSGVKQSVVWHAEAVHQLINYAVPDKSVLTDAGRTTLQDSIDFYKGRYGLPLCSPFMRAVFPHSPFAGGFKETLLLSEDPTPTTLEEAIEIARLALMRVDTLAKHMTEIVSQTMLLGRMPLSRRDEAYSLIYDLASKLVGSKYIEPRSTGYMQDSDVNVYIGVRNPDELVWEALGDLPPELKQRVLDELGLS